MRRMFSEKQLASIVAEVLRNQMLVNPTDLTNIPDTFATSPTGNQLPDADQSSLTADEVGLIKNHMLYWIRKGYIKEAANVLKISQYTIQETSLTFVASSITYDSGEIDSYETRRVGLNISNGTYFIATDSM